MYFWVSLLDIENVYCKFNEIEMKEKQTLQQYDEEMLKCITVFKNKTKDYGTSWRVLRPISITDQIMIKALRIRQIQETGQQVIADSIENEFRGIINYGIIALIQLSLPKDDQWELPTEEVEKYYKEKADGVRQLMLDKNTDYGEAWRQMTQQSMVDLILSKLQRIRKIIEQHGKTVVSEGIDANFSDIVNYAAFALIKITENIEI